MGPTFLQKGGRVGNCSFCAHISKRGMAPGVALSLHHIFSGQRTSPSVGHWPSANTSTTAFLVSRPSLTWPLSPHHRLCRPTLQLPQVTLTTPPHMWPVTSSTTLMTSSIIVVGGSGTNAHGVLAIPWALCECLMAFLKCKDLCRLQERKHYHDHLSDEGTEVQNS